MAIRTIVPEFDRAWPLFVRDPYGRSRAAASQPKESAFMKPISSLSLAVLIPLFGLTYGGCSSGPGSTGPGGGQNGTGLNGQTGGGASDNGGPTSCGKQTCGSGELCCEDISCNPVCEKTDACPVYGRPCQADAGPPPPPPPPACTLPCPTGEICCVGGPYSTPTCISGQVCPL